MLHRARKTTTSFPHSCGSSGCACCGLADGVLLFWTCRRTMGASIQSLRQCTDDCSIQRTIRTVGCPTRVALTANSVCGAGRRVGIGTGYWALAELLCWNQLLVPEP